MPHYLNIIVAVGGTGQEVLDNFLRIVERYPLKENTYEWFVIDTSPLVTADIQEFTDTHTNFVRLRGFSSSMALIRELMKNRQDANIGELFPEDDYYRNHPVNITDGAWEYRKGGFLALLEHLLTSGSRSILETISRRVSNEPGAGLLGVRIFVIASLAGGTGSGIVLPLGALLGSYLQRVKHLEIYALLAMPNAVAKGDRASSINSQKNFKANAYQALYELERLSASESKPEWVIKLSETAQFDLRTAERPVFDAVFLFDENNTRGANYTGASNAYKHYFQLMAWAAYLFASSDQNYRARVQQNYSPTKPFAGIGMHVLEFPVESLLRPLSSHLIERLTHHLNNLRGKTSEVRELASSYSLPFDHFRKELRGASHQNTLFGRFTAQMSKAAENIESLRTMEPDLEFPKGITSEAFLASHRLRLSKRTQEMLNQGFTVGDLIAFLDALASQVSDQREQSVRDKNSASHKVADLRKEVGAQRRAKHLLNAKKRYAASSYELMVEEHALQLIDGVRNDIKRRQDFLQAMRGLLNSSAIAQCHVAENRYFTFPPPQFVPENKMEVTADDLRSKLVKKYSESGKLATLDQQELELLDTFWNHFSLSVLNQKVAQWCEYYEYELTGRWERDRASNQSDLIDWTTGALKQFIATHHMDLVQEYNVLADYLLPDQKTHQNINLMSAPFVPLVPTVTEPEGVGHMAVGPRLLEQLNKRTLKPTQPLPTAFQLFPTDNLLVFFNLKGKLLLKDLMIEELKGNYEARKKTRDEDRGLYVFLIPSLESEAGDGKKKDLH